MPQPHPTGSFDALHGHAYASLTTLRRDGTPVVTPVWFALEGGRVYVVTTAESGKVKRIRNNAQVLLAPCTAGGTVLAPGVAGVVRILATGEWAGARRALDRKYGWRKRFADLVYAFRRKAPAYLEIAPA